MTTAREIMTPDPRCIGESESLQEAARLMAELDVGALPICGADGKLRGMLTDRDIVVKCVARGGRPAIETAGLLAERTLVLARADDDIRDVLRSMEQHQVRRVPVLDGDELVGIISQADIALTMSSTQTGEAVEAISE
ncbi:CBS domain-containing protein [Microbacterium gallinarum]|jgi:CBS domain-containing protein|uniref:CBS domain-containing protein n=1 Tax=Microbacterium gallinarum TaxID=2762209 RepID=A0ABR8X2K6_9MICO|nr:CBS domain-containing protein [Microbacterium gallinarum]MBD8023484.1 CBS domain-containing protein [Microbacterium gallinarum]